MLLACLLALTQAAPTPAPTATFHGRVVQAEDGAPVVRARAEVRWNRSSIHRSRSHGEPRHEIVDPPPWPSAETDEAGRFSIPYDATVAPWTVVEAETRSPGAAGLLAGHADAAHELVFALPRAARLEIQLDLDSVPLDERALERQYQVHAFAPLYATSFPAWLGVTSGDTRRTASAPAYEPLVLDHLPSGVPIRIEFTCDDATRIGGLDHSAGALGRELVLAAGSSQRITWTAPGRPSGAPLSDETGSLQVVLRDRNGHPAVGATVQLERIPRIVSRGRGSAAENEVDAEGRYARPDLRPGNYVVTVGGAWITQPATVRVDAGAQVVHSISVLPSRAIRGTVVEASGEPVADARIEFAPWSARDDWSYGARSDEQGEYVLHVPRDETGFVRAFHPATSDLDLRQIEMDTEILPDGTTRKIDLGAPRKLVFPATTKPRIHVVDAAGVPTAAQIRSGPRAVLGVTWRGDARALGEPELPLGERTVSAVTEDGRAAFGLLDVRPGAELTLRLAPAGILRLRHRGAPELLDVRVETVDGRVFGLTTLLAGVDEVVLVPPGTWSVRADGKPDRLIRVEAGIELLVEL